MTDLQRRLLDGNLAEDPSAVIGTNCLQLVLIEREELSAGQNTQAADGSAENTGNMAVRETSDVHILQVE